MKIKESIQKILKSKKSMVACAVALAVVIVGIVSLFTYNYTPAADTTSLNKLLLESSDLTTAKLVLTNMTEYKDEGIKLFNRSDFIMVYDATVWAGIDVEKIKITSDDIKKIIHVSIPKAIIQNVKVDSGTIKYFDEKFSLFNTNAKEDSNKAVALAEEAIKKDAVKTGILELADKQSATLIEGLLSNSIPRGYTIDAKVVK